MNLFIQGTTFLSAFMIFAFEDLAVESAPTYTMSKRNSTGMVEWSFEGTGCAVTCLGFRVHQGVPIEKSQVRSRSDEERRTYGWSEATAAYHPPLN